MAGTLVPRVLPNPRKPPLPKKLAFITIGATASFPALLHAVLTPTFLSSLEKHQYTDLLIQYGRDGRRILEAACPPGRYGLIEGYGMRIDGFDFRPDGLGEEMGSVAGRIREYERVGVCVSHAGSGTILDALRLGVPLIVVPNPTLLDDHQTELAEELARQGYVVHGRLDALEQALAESEALRVKSKEWPVATSNNRLEKIMDEEVGFTCLD